MTIVTPLLWTCCITDSANPNRDISTVYNTQHPLLMPPTTVPRALILQQYNCKHTRSLAAVAASRSAVRVGVGMAFRRRGWRRCGALLIPYIVIAYFINHLRILKITEKFEDTFLERSSNMDAIPGYGSNAPSELHGDNGTTNGKNTSVTLKTSHLTRDMLINSISSNASLVKDSLDISSNTIHMNNVSAGPCDSLPKPSHRNESQTFQPFHDKGHVFSAHYDYRENAIQVRFYRFPIITG